MQQIYRKTPVPKCDFNKVATIITKSSILDAATVLDPPLLKYKNLFMLHLLFYLKNSFIGEHENFKAL